MSRGLRRYLVSSVALLTLAACGRGFVSFEERAPWRKQAEESCLKSGAVKVSAAVAQIDPINGPGMCGAEFPLKVAALGIGNQAMGYGDDPRPPGGIPMSAQPRWPISQPQYASPSSGEPMTITPNSTGQPNYGPVSAPSARPGYAPANGPYAQPTYQQPSFMPPHGATVTAEPEMDEEDDIPDDAIRPGQGPETRPAYNAPRSASPRVPQIPQLAPPRGLYTGTAGPVAITPVATLACPIVSALDQWVSATVQPAAQRWFGQPVVEIKQISAYSCRGMNGQPGAHISEHAFGNALDIAGFILADGRKITVKTSWNASPEEQGFLHDVQGGACDTFSTVLAPGSNKYHFDHIHVDLMRRASQRLICQPRAIPGEVAAARAASRLAGRGDPTTTGSIGRAASNVTPKYAIPGEDDVFDDDIDEATSPAAQKRIQQQPGKKYDAGISIRSE
jgi:hypothetical protein